MFGFMRREFWRWVNPLRRQLQAAEAILCPRCSEPARKDRTSFMHWTMQCDACGKRWRERRPMWTRNGMGGIDGDYGTPF